MVEKGYSIAGVAVDRLSPRTTIPPPWARIWMKPPRLPPLTVRVPFASTVMSPSTARLAGESEPPSWTVKPPPQDDQQDRPRTKSARCMM